LNPGNKENSGGSSKSCNEAVRGDMGLETLILKVKETGQI